MKKALYYIGTYTWKTSKGIYGVYLDPATMEFSEPRLMAEVASPTYSVFNKDKTVMYTASEPIDNSKGAVTAYSIEPSTGELKMINQVQAPGRGLCHISINNSNTWLFAVSYSDATVQVYPIRDDGSVGELVCVREHVGKGADPTRQESAHAHLACLTPDEQYLCVCDLGIDKLVVYRFNSKTGQLDYDQNMTVNLPAGCGPRHMVFHPNGRLAYLLSELSSQVFVLSYHPENGFTVLQSINTLYQWEGYSIAAAIRISDDGKFLYTSNRGEDSISIFKIDVNTGLIEHIANTPVLGRHPRDFILSGSLLICANMDTDNITVFQVSKQCGTFVPVKEITGVSKPVSVLEYQLA